MAKPDVEEKAEEPPKREMLKYRDNQGNVVEFPKPPEPNIWDLIDQDKWGSDEEQIIIPEEELKDDVDDVSDDDEDEKQPSKPKEQLTEQEMLEMARRKQRRIEKREERRKIKRAKRKLEVIHERMRWEKHDTWDFPRDPDNWTEEDLGEEWADAPPDARGSGFDPEEPVVIHDKDTASIIAREREKERLLDIGIANSVKKFMKKQKQKAKNPDMKDESEEEDDFRFRPYYVPYRKPYPLIPKVHPEVNSAADVIDELEKIEEFLAWGSYIFPDGSSYEGTLWDDQAHGKGVYNTPFKLCRYEGEWFQNMMQGHGVMEVDVPVYQPVPDSKLEEEMRAEGMIMKADYMDPEDREFLKMDIEDTLKKPDAVVPVSNQFEDDPLWIEEFGELPEKGRYRYAGQWKHNRMHGCGVYEVNTRAVWGRFYFGELMLDEGECSFEACQFHAGIAEVASGKAKMFVKKPDGMVRQKEGPYEDPQHPYMYEEEDLWMAPGWINAYYEVPDPWKTYVEEVDKEQEMWLNSFIKSPLRLPMPSEAEYMWEKGEEFMLLGCSPTKYGWFTGENEERLKPEYEGHLLLHVPTGRLINWIYDEDGRVKMFWQPYKEDGSVNPEEAVFLPDGWDEFFSDKPQEPEKDEDAEFEEQMRKEEEEDVKEYQRQVAEAEAKRAKLKEEDEEMWERIRLIEVAFKEERQAAIEYNKQQKELEEEAAKRAAENVLEDEATTEEETPPMEEEPEEEAEEEEVAEEDRKPSFGKVEEDKPSFGKVQEEDGPEEDEDDKKPPSFGTVAMAGQAGFPTAWASITMTLSAWKFKLVESEKRVVEKQVAGNAVVDDEQVETLCVSIRFARKQQMIKLRASRGTSRICNRATRLPSCKKQEQGKVDICGTQVHLLSLALPVA